MKEIFGGITAPQGFQSAGIHSGIKRMRKDMALIYSESEGVAAGTFTTNQVKAAPVILNLDNLRFGRGQAIIVNSGNANACTGKQGLADAKIMVQETAKILKINTQSVYVCSTGVIGQLLPMKKVITGIRTVVENLSPQGNTDAAQAIMTTDRYPKEIAIEFQINGKKCRIGAIAKGAGMIAPKMTVTGNHATMLCFITTDVAIQKNILQFALSNAVENSFNRITVDNDCSTNDTVLILSNGLAGNKPISCKSSKELEIFQNALNYVCLFLAKLIVKDGEGATRLVEIHVQNGRSEYDTRKIAFTIANSPLVKTAIFGTDANWGRIMCAVGYSEIPIQPDKTDIILGGRESGKKNYKKIILVKKGINSGYDEKKAREILAHPEILIEIDLHQGKSGFTVWTCDLTIDYVKTNASYRS